MTEKEYEQADRAVMAYVVLLRSVIVNKNLKNRNI